MTTMTKHSKIELFNSGIPIDAFLCPVCRKNSLRIFKEKPSLILRCSNCGKIVNVKNGVIDLLGEPTSEVRNEIEGMIIESGRKYKHYKDFCIESAEYIPTTEELIKKSTESGEVYNYYESVVVNFEALIDKIDIKNGGTVLEIGSGSYSYILRRFNEMGFGCTALDIHFAVPKKEKNPDYLRILADMNNIPVKDETYDITIASATIHHSSKPERIFSELSRVTKQGGKVIVFNEPVSGLIKWFSHSSNPIERNELINEHVYSLFKYLSSAHKAGINPSLYFSEFISRKIATGATSGFRFGKLGKIISPFWKNIHIRRLIKKFGLYPGMLLFGLPLLMIGEKFRKK